MLELAAELADGVHPYNVTPEHTAKARAALGPDKLVCPEQMVLLETDPATARQVGRATLSIYMGLPNYLNNLLRLGFSEDDLAGGGSDRLIDGLIAWGDEAAIRRRIQEHWDAGADHVCIQAIPRSGGMAGVPEEEVLALLAPAA
jgi:probable F420-dependent oxidoreductase